MESQGQKYFALLELTTLTQVNQLVYLVLLDIYATKQD